MSNPSERTTMRFNRILAAILCIAGLAACEKETRTDVSPEGGETDVITVSMDIPSTRLNLQMDGYAMKTKWEVGDSLSVVYHQSGYDANDNYYDRYVNDPYYIKKAGDISADGKSARFSCDNPHFSYGVSNNKVTVVYPYLYKINSNSLKPEISIDGQYGGSFENIKRYLLMGAPAIDAGTDGIEGKIALKPYVSVLKFSAGLRIESVYSNDKFIVNDVVVRQNYFHYMYLIDGYEIQAQRKGREMVVRPDGAYLENQKLSKDIYMVVGFDGNPYTPTSQVGAYIVYDDGNSAIFSLKPRTLQPGYVYTITAESLYTD